MPEDHADRLANFRTEIEPMLLKIPGGQVIMHALHRFAAHMLGDDDDAVLSAPQTGTTGAAEHNAETSGIALPPVETDEDGKEFRTYIRNGQPVRVYGAAPVYSYGDNPEAAKPMTDQPVFEPIDPNDSLSADPYISAGGTYLGHSEADRTAPVDVAHLQAEHPQPNDIADDRRDLGVVENPQVDVVDHPEVPTVDAGQHILTPEEQAASDERARQEGTHA